MLKGKVVLITGASRGIGRETSLLFAKNHADIIINYNRSKENALELLNEIRTFSERATAIQADVANRIEVEAMFKTNSF